MPSLRCMFRSHLILFKTNQFRFLFRFISIMHFPPQQRSLPHIPATRQVKNSHWLENWILPHPPSADGLASYFTEKQTTCYWSICYYRSISSAFIPVYPYLKSIPSLTHQSHPFSPTPEILSLFLPHQIPLCFGSVGTANKYTIIASLLISFQETL